VAGVRWVILCQRPIFRMTEFTFSSRTRNALLSENNYEIFSTVSSLAALTSLEGSCTAMGTITFTLTFISEDEGVSPVPSALMWKDSILTYRNRDVLQTVLPTAVRTMAKLWFTAIFPPTTREEDGELYWTRQQQENSFLSLCEQDFRVTLSYILDAWWNFANGVSEERRLSTVDEPENSFENLLP